MVLGRLVKDGVEGLPVDLARVDVVAMLPWNAQNRTRESGCSEAKNGSIWDGVAMPPHPALIPQHVAS